MRPEDGRSRGKADLGTLMATQVGGICENARGGTNIERLRNEILMEYKISAF